LAEKRASGDEGQVIMDGEHDATTGAGDDVPCRQLPAGGRPALIGEVLFDLFPDGRRVLGGAPFNVAWHLQAFGLLPLLVTRIGDDARGEEVHAAMAAWGMDLSGVQIDSRQETGQVRVSLDDGTATFEISPDQAWDLLDADAAVAAIGDAEAALLYHGTLAARSGDGRAAVGAVRDCCRLPVLVDVNLRDPWWSRGVVAGLLDAARWAKLNDDELSRLGPGTSGPATEGLEAAAAALADRHGLEQVVVTCGEVGAFVWAEGRRLAGRPPAGVEVVDTVGAGDAFSAVWIAGLLRGWSPQIALTRALAFAASVCTVRGATTADRRIHDLHLETWERE
jgi:fructokinase